MLVNIAGSSFGARPEELSAADWDWVLRTNLTSTFLMSQAAYPLLKREGGKIV